MMERARETSGERPGSCEADAGKRNSITQKSQVGSLPHAVHKGAGGEGTCTSFET